MELNKVSEAACPPDIIAIAINGKSRAQHCGIIYTDSTKGLQLCDMRWEHDLNFGQPPKGYFWIKVRLDPEEAALVAAFIEMVIAQEKLTKIPYSFIYHPDGFDVTGKIRSGLGVTCATFVINIFDRLQFQLVDVSTWKSRPKQDTAFRKRIIDAALWNGQYQFAQRLAGETEGFRIKPWEVYGSASHSSYPVKFVQAVKKAETVSKLLRKRK